MEGIFGIEPKHSESKSDALPLCYIPKMFALCTVGERTAHACLPIIGRSKSSLPRLNTLFVTN